MKIRMTGLDYRSAGLSEREKFALGDEAANRVSEAFTALPFVGGCVVIFTCNRTEVYLSLNGERQFSIAGFLCQTLGLEPESYTRLFTERDEPDTFFHLCEVASGMGSQILGDDQIITQVREALEAARASGYSDGYLETAFNTAIKAAKQIKTHITVRSPRMSSAPYRAVEKIKTVTDIARKSAVVIGNGRMGRLAAELLIGESARVTVTLREYKKGNIEVPAGAETVGYSSRYAAIEHADIVLSATKSPHYTLRRDEFIRLNSLPGIVVDLSVPRDVEPEIGALAGVKLFTIDDLGDGGDALPYEKQLYAERIIEENLQKYYKWREYKENLK